MVERDLAKVDVDGSNPFTRSIDNWVIKRLIPYIQVTPRFYLYDFEAVLEAIKKHYQIDAKPR